LQSSAAEVREFDGEGLMTTWVLHYLCDLGTHPFPEKYYNAPLARSVAAGFERQDRRRTRAALMFDAADGAELAQAMNGVSPTEAEMLEYWRGRLEEALGVEGAQRRMREDASVPELVATCHGAFNWLLECVGRISTDAVGLLVVRDARRGRLMRPRLTRR
jgi:hypothetical protein